MNGEIVNRTQSTSGLYIETERATTEIEVNTILCERNNPCASHRGTGSMMFSFIVDSTTLLDIPSVLMHAENGCIFVRIDRWRIHFISITMVSTYVCERQRSILWSAEDWRENETRSE